MFFKRQETQGNQKCNFVNSVNFCRIIVYFRVSGDVKDSAEYQITGFGKHSYNAEEKYPKTKFMREKITD